MVDVDLTSILTSIESVASILGSLATVAGCVGIFYAGVQIKHSKHASLMAVEDSLATARAAWQEAESVSTQISKEVHTLAQQGEISAGKRDDLRGKVETAEIRELQTREQFLNRLDRICASINDDIISQSRGRRDYEQMIRAVGDAFPSVLVADSAHDNIRSLYFKWHCGSPRK